MTRARERPFHTLFSRQHFVTRATIQSINKYKRERARRRVVVSETHERTSARNKKYILPSIRARVVARRTFNLQKAQCRTIASMTRISRQIFLPAFRRVAYFVTCNVICLLHTSSLLTALLSRLSFSSFTAVLCFDKFFMARNSRAVEPIFSPKGSIFYTLTIANNWPWCVIVGEIQIELATLTDFLCRASIDLPAEKSKYFPVAHRASIFNWSHLPHRALGMKCSYLFVNGLAKGVT